MGQFSKQMEGLYLMGAFSWAADYASRPDTMAAYLDSLIKSKDTIEQIVRAAEAEGKKRRLKTKFTEGTIHAHIKFRVQQAGRNKAG
jgi:hypothetical protein